MHVVEATFQRLCIRQQDGHGDRSVSLTELQLAPGVSEALMNEALWVLTFPVDIRRRAEWPWGRIGVSDVMDSLDNSP